VHNRAPGIAHRPAPCGGQGGPEVPRHPSNRWMIRADFVRGKGPGGDRPWLGSRCGDMDESALVSPWVPAPPISRSASDAGDRFGLKAVAVGPDTAGSSAPAVEACSGLFGGAMPENAPVLSSR